MLWDIFCRVVDNFGDIGVCWRLSADLASRGEKVRLWVDDASALDWMAPGSAQSDLSAAPSGVQVMPWLMSTHSDSLRGLRTADVWIEAFGCEIDAAFVAYFANQFDGAHAASRPVWINLEYLSAEPFVERAHALRSPVMQGPAKGGSKFFFYPGFTERTGGLIREQGLTDRQRSFSQQPCPVPWLEALTLNAAPLPGKAQRTISLFCYEPAGLARLLSSLMDDCAFDNHLLVTHGRATAAVKAVMGASCKQGNLRVSYLPRLSQIAFDELLWHCDINFVRGEDSLVRALWAGKPFVWQIYPQDDNAHIAKLMAFLDYTEASSDLRALHCVWNGINVPGSGPEETAAQLLPPLPAWQHAASALRSRQMRLPDLTGTLIQFVHKNR